MRKLVGDYRGQVIDEPGDALLALFHRPADALNFGLQVQREFRNEAAWSCGGQPLPFRIGINFGHVIEDRDRVYGHAVNVAERIQRRASPGGVCVSEAFRSAVGQEPAMRLHSLGQLRLEGIEERTELFAVETYDPPMPAASPFTPAQEPVRSPHEPAVVVLSFANLSDDTADEHFCVGIAADVIAGLTRFRNLLVIAPHSASVFKDSALPRERIAQRLGVQYLVSGSLQRAGDRLRLRVQLSETQGGVLWSEHYDGEMSDVFAFQDDTVTTVVARLGVRINDAERCRALRLRAPVLDAYGLVLRADDLVHRYRREANLHARRLLEQAVEADRGYGRAYAGLSRTFNHASRYRWAQDPARCLDRAAELARQAVERDGLDARGHAELGMALLHRKEHDASLAAYRYALKLNPNDADILADYAGALVCDGSARDALETLRHAMRLNPWCPDWYLWTLASAHFALGELGETVAIVRRMRDPSQGRRLLVASYAHLGMMCEAKAEAREILASQPDFTISDWAARLPHNRERVPFEHFVEGLRRAGLPTG